MNYILLWMPCDFEPCKPDPSAALHICRQWQLDPHQVAIVGDDKTDMICGIRAGTGCKLNALKNISISTLYQGVRDGRSKVIEAYKVQTPIAPPNRVTNPTQGSEL